MMANTAYDATGKIAFCSEKLWASDRIGALCLTAALAAMTRTPHLQEEARRGWRFGS